MNFTSSAFSCSVYCIVLHEYVPQAAATQYFQLNWSKNGRLSGRQSGRQFRTAAARPTAAIKATKQANMPHISIHILAFFSATYTNNVVKWICKDLPKIQNNKKRRKIVFLNLLWVLKQINVIQNHDALPAEDPCIHPHKHTYICATWVTKCIIVIVVLIIIYIILIITYENCNGNVETAPLALPVSGILEYFIDQTNGRAERTKLRKINVEFLNPGLFLTYLGVKEVVVSV